MSTAVPARPVVGAVTPPASCQVCRRARALPSAGRRLLRRRSHCARRRAARHPASGRGVRAPCSSHPQTRACAPHAVARTTDPRRGHTRRADALLPTDILPRAAVSRAALAPGPHVAPPHPACGPCQGRRSEPRLASRHRRRRPRAVRERCSGVRELGPRPATARSSPPPVLLPVTAPCRCARSTHLRYDPQRSELVAIALRNVRPDEQVCRRAGGWPRV